MKPSLVFAAVLCSTQALAYDCNQSQKYREEYESFEKGSPLDIDSLNVGVAFLVERKHLTTAAAHERMLKILLTERPPIFMRVKQKLEDVVTELKAANPNSEAECLALMNLRRERRRLGQQMTKYTVARLISSDPAMPASPPQCVSQKLAEDHVSEICLTKGADFDHDYFMLRVDGIEVFHLADDYAEAIALKHKVPTATTIEFPLSLQGPTEVEIRGGCTPIERDGALAAHVCNFTWGEIQIIRDARFESD